MTHTQSREERPPCNMLGGGRQHLSRIIFFSSLALQLVVSIIKYFLVFVFLLLLLLLLLVILTRDRVGLFAYLIVCFAKEMAESVNKSEGSGRRREEKRESEIRIQREWQGIEKTKETKIMIQSTIRRKKHKTTRNHTK